MLERYQHDRIPLEHWSGVEWLRSGPHQGSCLHLPGERRVERPEKRSKRMQ